MTQVQPIPTEKIVTSLSNLSNSLKRSVNRYQIRCRDNLLEQGIPIVFVDPENIVYMILRSVTLITFIVKVLFTPRNIEKHQPNARFQMTVNRKLISLFRPESLFCLWRLGTKTRT